MTDQPAGYPPPPQHNAAGFGAPQGQPQPGQPQQGFGAAPDGQAGFGAAPGQPQFGAPGQQPQFGAPGQPQFGAPGQQPPAFGAPGSFTPEEPKKGGGKGRLAGILGVVAVVGIGLLIKVAIGFGAGAAANALYQDPTKDAKVGDCLGDTPELKEGEQGNANNVGIVDCGSADATSVIIGRKDNLTSIQARDEEQCYEYVNDGESFTMLWPIEADENQYYVLCLKDK
ncbi:LppU/SCO3897 family protein [Catenuloplanes japonicus]|uniref:LppU/SCO3897 family protein n=1 Tax=Catenuloplanes japonicus TaxID=33876 RepID=UPI000526FCBC|nr:hypothetical protein [Catenuloplanes japonicus]